MYENVFRLKCDSRRVAKEFVDVSPLRIIDQQDDGVSCDRFGHQTKSSFLGPLPVQ